MRRLRLMIDPEKKMVDLAPEKSDCIIPVEKVIYGGGGFVASGSLFYCATLEKNLPPFRRLLDYDYTIQIHGAMRGGMLYLEDSMSVYRCLAVGSWSTNMQQDPEKRKAHEAEVEKMLRQLDMDTDGKYHEVIECTLLRREFDTCRYANAYKDLLDARFRKCLESLPRSERLKIFLKAYFPGLSKLFKMLKNI